ncbi:MAG: hypothetical protein ACI9AT_001123 [Ulvibacter sp.]|jgi:hypothetical protein
MKNFLKTTFLIFALMGNGYAFCNDHSENQAMNNPVAVCQDITKMLNANGTLNVNPAELDGGSFDANGPVTFAADINYLYCEHIGVNSITLLVTDNEGYVSVCTALVTVIDLITPSAICKDFNVILDDNNEASITVSNIDDASFDNCTIADMSLSKTEFTIFDIGTTNVVLTVTDESGNSNECISVVQLLEQPALNPHDILAAFISPTPEEIDTDLERKGSEISMNIFPNPALHGQTTIALGNMPKGQKDITVVIYDIFGMAIRNERLVENDIETKMKMDNLDTLNSGVYTIHVSIDGKTLSQQLVVR